MSHKTGLYSIVKTRTSNLSIWWAGGVLPPMIYPHKIVCGVGKIATINDGELIRINEAVPIMPKYSYWSVMGPLYKYLWHFLEDPEQWCTPEQLEPFKLRRYEIDR